MVAHEKDLPLDRLLHQQLAYIMLGTALPVWAEVKWPHSFLATMCRVGGALGQVRACGRGCVCVYVCVCVRASDACVWVRVHACMCMLVSNKLCESFCELVPGSSRLIISCPKLFLFSCSATKLLTSC